MSDSEDLNKDQIIQLIRGERPYTLDDNGEKVYMRWEEFKTKRKWAKLAVKEKLKGTWVHKATEIKEEIDGNGNKKKVVAHYGSYVKKNKNLKTSKTETNGN